MEYKDLKNKKGDKYDSYIKYFFLMDNFCKYFEE